MVDLRYIKKLIDIIDDSSVDSIEITSDKGMKIRISKSPQQRGALQVAAPMPVPAILPATALARVSPANGVPTVDGETPKEPAKESSLLEIKSPMVGTFYKSPEPGAKAYVGVGDRVSKGQIVCIIEAMKIMNEIESEFSGTVREILAQDAEPIEYGQVLFRIDPHG